MNTEAPSREKADCAPIVQQTGRALAPLKCDPEKYRKYLDAFELSQEEQDELLGVVWKICRTFVEIGFGLDSVQNIFSLNLENALQDTSGAVDKKDHFNQRAGHEGEQEERRRG